VEVRVEDPSYRDLRHFIVYEKTPALRDFDSPRDTGKELVEHGEYRQIETPRSVRMCLRVPAGKKNACSDFITIKAPTERARGRGTILRSILEWGRGCRLH